MQLGIMSGDGKLARFAALENQLRVARSLSDSSSGLICFPLHDTCSQSCEEDRLFSQLCLTLIPEDRNDKNKRSTNNAPIAYKKVVVDNSAINLKRAVKRASPGARFHCYWVYVHDDEVRGIAHCCCLLVDIVSRAAIIYEPYGSQNFPQSKLVQVALTNSILAIYAAQNKQSRSNVMINSWGPQTPDHEYELLCKKPGDPTGFCFAWCVHFIAYVKKRVALEKPNTRSQVLRGYLCKYLGITKDVINGGKCGSTNLIRPFILAFDY